MPPAVLEAAPQVYSHRNGETEPPTEPGYYWFQYKWRRTKKPSSKGGLMACVFVSVAKTLAVAVMFTDIRYGINEINAYWYGPVTPPWESE